MKGAGGGEQTRYGGGWSCGGWMLWLLLLLGDVDVLMLMLMGWWGR
jgi:hypothetical protein